MKNQVIIVADKNTGEVVRPRTITDKQGNTREVGVIMVQSKALAGLSSIGNVSTRTAFITLEQNALEFLGADLRDGAAFPVAGKICIAETLVPYIKKDGTPQEAKMNPSTQEVVTYHGQPVYRNSFFSEDVTQPDVFLKETAAVAEGVEAPE